MEQERLKKKLEQENKKTAGVVKSEPPKKEEIISREKVICVFCTFANSTSASQCGMCQNPIVKSSPQSAPKQPPPVEAASKPTYVGKFEALSEYQKNSLYQNRKRKPVSRQCTLCMLFNAYAPEEPQVCQLCESPLGDVYLCEPNVSVQQASPSTFATERQTRVDQVQQPPQYERASEAGGSTLINPVRFNVIMRNEALPKLTLDIVNNIQLVHNCKLNGGGQVTFDKTLVVVTCSSYESFLEIFISMEHVVGEGNVEFE